MSFQKKINRLLSVLVKSKNSFLSRSSLRKYLQVHQENMFLLKILSKGSKEFLSGEYDHLPESAFYMVGDMNEAIEKAAKAKANNRFLKEYNGYTRI